MYLKDDQTEQVKEAPVKHPIHLIPSPHDTLHTFFKIALYSVVSTPLSRFNCAPPELLVGISRSKIAAFECFES